jgi:excisionase family DNA binding protein
MTRLLTTAEAAATLVVHPVTLRRWASEGRMPAAVRVGGRWRFDADLLTEPLDGAAQTPRERPQRRGDAIAPSLDAALTNLVGGAR